MEKETKLDKDFPLEIEKSYNGNKLVLYIKGRIDHQTSGEFQRSIDEYFEGESLNDLIFDFSEVEYVSSAGLRAILYTQKKIKNMDSGTNFMIINVHEKVMEIFDMTGFTDIINIVPISSKNK